MKKRVGLFGARADNSGLGNQTFEFWRHMNPDKTAVIDISSVTGKESFNDRFTGEGVSISTGFPTPSFIDRFLDDLDVVFLFEVPYNYYIFNAARERGIKTILQYNFEFLDYLREKLPMPDLFVAPNKWHFLHPILDERGINPRVLLPFPVNREVLPFRRRTQCKTFIHVSGYKLFEDRNGTDVVLEAIKYVKSQDVKFIIYSQHPLEVNLFDPRVEVREMNVANYADLYNEGDVLMLPRRYGGQSLQFNEAVSTGMIPLMIRCEPLGEYLLEPCGVPITDSKTISTRVDIDCYRCNPQDYAAAIDRLAGMNEPSVAYLSEHSNHVAKSLDWQFLKPRYENLVATW